MILTVPALLQPRSTARGIVVGPVRPAWPAEPCRDSLIRWLAYQRGFNRETFATADEGRHPGYDRAWRAGRRAARNAWDRRAA